MQLISLHFATAPRARNAWNDGQVQAEQSQRAGVQEIATCQSVAEMDRPRSIDAEHTWHLSLCGLEEEAAQ